MLGRGGKEFGEGGQIEDPDALRPSAQFLGQTWKIHALGDIQGHVVQARGKGLPGSLIEIAGGYMLPHVALHELPIAVLPMAGAGYREDAAVGMQMPVAVQVVQRGQQLAQGQIAGPAKYHDVTGLTVLHRHAHSPLWRQGARICSITTRQPRSVFSAYHEANA